MNYLREPFIWQNCLILNKTKGTHKIDYMLFTKVNRVDTKEMSFRSYGIHIAQILSECVVLYSLILLYIG